MITDEENIKKNEIKIANRKWTDEIVQDLNRINFPVEIENVPRIELAQRRVIMMIINCIKGYIEGVTYNSDCACRNKLRLQIMRRCMDALSDSGPFISFLKDYTCYFKQNKDSGQDLSLTLNLSYEASVLFYPLYRGIVSAELDAIGAEIPDYFNELPGNERRAD